MKKLRGDTALVRDIVKKLCAKYDLFEEELNKIIAFCFPAWGSRRLFRKEKIYRYKLKWRKILDVPNTRFQRVVDRAIRFNRNKLLDIDTLWTLRSIKSNQEGEEYSVNLPDREYLQGDAEVDLDLDNILYSIDNDD